MHFPTRLLNDTLADVQTYTDSLLVHSACPSDFSKLLKGLGHLACSDSFTCVDDVNLYLFTCIVVGRHNFDRTINGELESIFGKVN